MKLKSLLKSARGVGDVLCRQLLELATLDGVTSVANLKSRFEQGTLEEIAKEVNKIKHEGVERFEGVTWKSVISD